ncbi:MULTISPECIES: hypothetical protein [Nonomuraea]|uniref:Transposase n=1 Tax=Nonomuraea ferruginea TaxID=46174 RepID=A0ABT4SPV3_9ACTN|nr:hypothetical protein [Nonomuraea ferruginea]MDA0639272.1 hypothetical protein [Nonomuraea ferruginea]
MWINAEWGQERIQYRFLDSPSAICDHRAVTQFMRGYARHEVDAAVREWIEQLDKCL